MGIYSNKIEKLDDLQEGMKVGIPRDPTNRSRALRFLEAEGLIKLKEGVEEYSKLEIEENKLNLDLTELDSELIPTILDDLDAGLCYPIAMKEAGFDDIEVKNVSIPSLPEDVDIVVTHKSLTDRAIAVRPNAIHYSVENFLEGEQYDAIIEKIKETR